MKRNKKMFLLVLAVFIILFGYFLVYIKPDHYVDVFTYIVNKSSVENNYFIYVDNEFENHSKTKLECTKQQYDNLIIDEKLQYHIAYEYNSHSPQKGKLIILDLNNTIDNRTVSKPVQQVTPADFKDISTDYFTIKVPSGWSASMEVDKYSLILNLNNEDEAPVGSVQMLALGAKLYPTMDSDLYKQVIHKNEKNGQTTIITVLYTDQVDEHNAAIITDIMKDSLNNKAVFSTNQTTMKSETTGNLEPLTYEELTSFKLLHSDWTEDQFDDAGFKKEAYDSGLRNYSNGYAEYSFGNAYGNNINPDCVTVYGKTDVDGPRGIAVGDTFKEVLAKFPQEKEWQTSENGLFYGQLLEDQIVANGHVTEYQNTKRITLVPAEGLPFIQIEFMDDVLTEYRIYFITD